MASVNWMKATTQKAGGMKKHLGQQEREQGNHSNEHINKELSQQNYAIGCNDYVDALEQMKLRTKEVDEITPPKRIRKDRVTCCFLELPCPREITEQGKSDEFFKKAHAIYENFFGKANTHGTFVHKDEVHTYTDKNGNQQTSCEHSHTLVSAFTEDKGINGKAFETKAKINALNTAMDDMCMKQFGIHLNTGETAERKSAETLKKESEARQKLGELQSEVDETLKKESEARQKLGELQSEVDEYEPTPKKFLETQKAYEERVELHQTAIAIKQREQAVVTKEQEMSVREQAISEPEKEIQRQADELARHMTIEKANKQIYELSRECYIAKESKEKAVKQAVTDTEEKYKGQVKSLSEQLTVANERSRKLGQLVEDYEFEITGNALSADEVLEREFFTSKKKNRGYEYER